MAFISKITNSLPKNTLKNVFSGLRFYGIANQGQRLAIYEFGDPSEVVKLENHEVGCPKDNQVLVEMLLASMNPADMNSIQGTYPIKPKLPGVPGFEGVGKVLNVGPMVRCFRKDDIVMPNNEALGSWRTHLLVEETDLMKVPTDISLPTLVGLGSNASTAFRMLHDFVLLAEGDVVIQNGANSAAGQNVIQIAKSMKLKTVNVVRDRHNFEALKDSLEFLGADYVLREEELRSTKIFGDKIPHPRLALNCIGGKSASEVVRKLCPGGTMVTYGGMSKEPVTVPTTLFIFKSVCLRGFWMTGWTRAHRNTPDQISMFERLYELIRSGALKAPNHTLIPLGNYKDALTNMTSPQGKIGTKYIIDFSASSC